MRSLLITLAIAVLGTSVVGQQSNIVIHANEILSVCADNADVEIVACTRTAPPMPGPSEAFPGFAFSFPIVPSAEMANGIHIRSASYGAGIITLRIRLKDSKTAMAVAAFIEAQQTRPCSPPLPPNADGPFA